jgi:WD40 repeat protein
MNNNQPGNGEEDEEDVFHDAIEDDDQAAMASPLLRNSMSRESLQSIGTMDSDVSTMSVWLQTKEGTGMPPTPDPSLTRETGAVRPLEDPLKHPLQHLVVRSSASTPSLSPPPDQSATSLQGESTTTTCSFNNDASNCLRPNSRTSPDALTTKTKGKLRAAFRNWHLVQTLGDEEFPVQGAVLTVALSPCGLYLATAGVDRVIRIYALRVRSLLKEPTSSGSSIDLVGEEMYEREPLQRLRGHLGEVLAMAWSRDAVDCLLTGGMDGTVRLWNAVKGTCLGVFPHGDGVTSLVFHPKDERLFLTGCLDCRLRLWSVEQRTVLSWNELPAGNHVTAVAFTGERLCLAGTSTGFLLFFQLSADGRAMKYNTQVHVRSQHGKNKQGRKITSVLSVPTKFGGDPRVHSLYTTPHSNLAQCSTRY